MNTGVNISKVPKKVDLDNLKSEIDKLDVDELESAPVHSSKLSDVVKMQLLKSLHLMN